MHDDYHNQFLKGATAVSYTHLFIATLGSMMLSKGLGSIFTKAQSVTWPQSSHCLLYTSFGMIKKIGGCSPGGADNGGG